MKPKVYGWSSLISLMLVSFAILFKDYFWISMLIIAISGIIFYFLHKEFRADKKLNYEIFDTLKG
jgi:type II secretory pathway component PulF